MSNEVTTKQERAVAEQSTTSVVVVSSEQILTVIEQVHACYDYCAAWKEPTQQAERAEQGKDGAEVTEIKP